jgi:hypothetical protein
MTSRKVLALRKSRKCYPQLFEPLIGQHYVAIHRKKGPIGYIGAYKGKNNCMYQFDRNYDGNKYLFKHVRSRNPISGSIINNTMINDYFSIYHKDGSILNQVCNTFILLGRKNNRLIFLDDRLKIITCGIKEYDFEIVNDYRVAAMDKYLRRANILAVSIKTI